MYFSISQESGCTLERNPIPLQNAPTFPSKAATFLKQPDSLSQYSTTQDYINHCSPSLGAMQPPLNMKDGFDQPICGCIVQVS